MINYIKHPDALLTEPEDTYTVVFRRQYTNRVQHLCELYKSHTKYLNKVLKVHL